VVITKKRTKEQTKKESKRTNERVITLLCFECIYLESNNLCKGTPKSRLKPDLAIIRSFVRLFVCYLSFLFICLFTSCLSFVGSFAILFAMCVSSFIELFFSFVCSLVAEVYVCCCSFVAMLSFFLRSFVS
jgi:hypothetical protein